MVAWARGDRNALEHHTAAGQRMGHAGGTATVLETAALRHHQRGDHHAAIQALAAANEQRTRSGTAAPPELAEPLHRLETQLRATVGASEFTRHWQDRRPAPAVLSRPEAESARGGLGRPPAP